MNTDAPAVENGSNDSNGAHGPQAPNGDAAPVLPQPITERWQPLRSGLYNLYRYDWQEFWFDHGRLLLRGNNGTGKSRVLALQLPFLLDGEMLPQRIEPDGDPAKRIEWNLLMNRHNDRLGYTWLEFGRRENGVSKFFTIGIGMHAHAGRGAPDRWFFVTNKRLGQDLGLRGVHGNLHSRDRLEAAVGDSGHVFTAARDYRDAIDKELFQLGDQRYRALIELLIRLRKPQLTRDLNETLLSDALSEALPPILPNVLADVAEAFKSLERDRTDLRGFETAETAVEQFLREYVPYSKIATRRRSEDLRTRHNAYELAMRRLRDAEKLRDSAALSVEQLKSDSVRIDELRHAASARYDQLRDSPAMQDARELERLRSEARTATTALEGRERETAEAQRHSDAAKKSAEAAHAQFAARKTTSGEARSAALAAAQAAACAEVHQRKTDAALDENMGSERLAQLRARALDALVKRNRSIDHLRTLHSRWSGANAERVRLEAKARERKSELDQALTTQTQAQSAIKIAVDAVLAAYSAWRATCKELQLPPSESFEDEFRLWTDAADGADSPLTVVVNRSSDDAVKQLSAEFERTASDLRQLEAQAKELDAQISALQQGRHTPPPAPYTRDTERRQTLPGAPLWKLIEFRAEVSESHRVGFEAALEASGLLDAWVTPDGKVQLEDQQDVFIDPERDPAAQNNLGTVLKPCAQELVSSAVTEAILARIAVGSGAGRFWVDANGAWANGPLTGRWTKLNAQHIGETAREAERVRRLAELSAERAAYRSKIDETRSAQSVLQARLESAAAERRRAPPLQAVLQAVANANAATAAVVAAQLRVTEASAQAQRAVERADTERTTLEHDARDLGLLECIDDLPGLQSRQTEYRQSLNELFSAWDHLLAAVQRLSDAIADAAHRQIELDQRRQHEEQARITVAEAVARRDALEKVKGESVEAILAEIEAARADREKQEQDLKEVTRLHLLASNQYSAAAQQATSDEAIVLEREADRNNAVESLRRLVDAGLLRVLDSTIAPADLTSPTAAVALAREMETRLTGLVADDAAWNKAHDRLLTHIRSLEEALLPHDIRPEPIQSDGLWLLTAPFRGQSMDLPAFQLSLHDEVSQRLALLEQKEREVLENTLVGDLAAHLHRCIRDGETFIKGVNVQIESRPTGTGMKLRFLWETKDDGPSGLLEARKRLLGSAGTWSVDDREALGRFLQSQIQESRLADQTGSWEEHLARALDYRHWHQFAIQRYQDGRWVRLTRRTHGTGSGGEKALALTLPMFAAAAAHYSSAHPLAPRLIMLDEAFVGIDSEMRRKCMGLLAEFDLDFMMTSEREWGCYDTLPGVAIYQLAAVAGIDAVYTSRWTWNGRQKSAAAQPAPVTYVADDDTDTVAADSVENHGN